MLCVRTATSNTFKQAHVSENSSHNLNWKVHLMDVQNALKLVRILQDYSLAEIIYKESASVV
jgi:hypothetical protein